MLRGRRHRLLAEYGAAERGDEADEAFGGTVPRTKCRLMPAPAGNRGHRFAAYRRCSADVEGQGRVMVQDSVAKRRFLPQGRREWRTAGAVAVFAVAAGGVVSWAGAHISGSAFAILAVALLAMEPWLQERVARRQGKAGSHSLLRGRVGRVSDGCNPTGRVTVDGTVWAARSLDADPLPVGAPVYVHDGDGLVLHVSTSPPTM